MTPSAPEHTSFGKYQILGRIAVGGTAEIYKARLEGEGGFHRTFALKRILPHLSSRTDFVDMLVEEAKIAGLLSHANIVQIMDLGEVGGAYYIAMEYVNGPDLGRILNRCRDKGITLPVPHATFLVIEVLKALEYAHNRRVMRGGTEMPLNIVHRDISPTNVLVSFHGEVKLTDFGIAKASVTALQTVSGIIKGRFDYLAPEQAAGHKPDARADLFAAGVLLYECLVGQHPFKQRSEAATIDAIRDGSFPPPSAINPDIPYALELVVERALKADPTDRFQTATEFKDALDRFFQDAGFIFSHSTLAAFLKGLFPQEAAASAQGPAPFSTQKPALTSSEPGPLGPALEDEDRLPTEEQSTQALVRPSLHAPFAAADRPTQVDLGPDSIAGRPTVHDVRIPAPDDPFGIADSTTQRPNRRGVSGAMDIPLIPGGAPLAGFGQEATLIRTSPPAQPEPGEWGDLETVIRPSPTALQRQQGVPTDPDSTRRIPKPRAGPRQPMHDTQAVGISARPRPARRHLHIVYVGLIALGSIIGLVAGALLTQSRLAQVPADPALAVPQLPPQLRVQLPDGATLRVDGRTTPGPSPIRVPLSPGITHNIDVQIEGFNPISTRMKLQANEVRVLSFQTEPLQAQQH